SSQFTSEEFANQINLNTFKNKIAEYLNINVNAIGNIEFTNNVLSISPNSMYKFKSSSDNNLINDAGIIQINDFTFFKLYDIVNLDALYTAINNYIATSTDKFTEAQFANNVANSPSSIKTEIANNLQLQLGNDIQNVAIDNITNVVYQDNQLEITLSDNYFKYQQTTLNDNVSLEGNKVIVTNLHFYKELEFNGSDLTTLRTNIQNLINDNSINSQNINIYLSGQIFNLIKNVDTVNNGNIEQYISTPTYSSNTINIPLKSDVGLYKFKVTSFTNISISSNQISLNSIRLIDPPTPSPTNWFTWDGTKISGLTELGKQQTEFVLPSFTTEVMVRGAFFANKTVTSIDMSLTKITYFNLNRSEDSVFEQCTNLQKVVLPPNLEFIGYDSFYNCTSLTEISKLPNTLKYIGGYAFSGNKFSSIKIPNSVINIASEGNVIGQSVKISNYAFGKNPNLREVIFENNSNLKSIGNFTFISCTSLQSVTLPNSITSLGSDTFNSCTSLQSVTLPNSITNLPNNTFIDCNKLQSITLPDTIQSLGLNVFSKCLQIESITLPNSLVSIGDTAFSNCINLKSIIIGDKVSSIGSRAFLDCTSLTEITLPNSITSIGNNAFSSSLPNDQYKPLPIVIFVNSNSVENLVKSVFTSGTVINLSRP
ncbi:MAG: leucine-rich repeat domain-containing protein, partial [Ureaplasma sp.]|nr:leucine-rich repeat domain-containing protein [Ureaplasma sp.]